MKLGSEFQSRNYSAIVSHTTIVFVRYILLEWIRRNRNDRRSYGELFFMFCDDIQDIDLTNALQGLMSLFRSVIKTFSEKITDTIKSQVITPPIKYCHLHKAKTWDFLYNKHY